MPRSSRRSVPNAAWRLVPFAILPGCSMLGALHGADVLWGTAVLVALAALGFLVSRGSRR